MNSIIGKATTKPTRPNIKYACLNPTAFIKATDEPCKNIFPIDPPAVDKALPLLASSNQAFINRGIPNADIIAAPICIIPAIKQYCHGAVAIEKAAKPPQPNIAPAMYKGLRLNFLNKPPTIGEPIAETKVPIVNIKEKLAILKPNALSLTTQYMNCGCKLAKTP